MEAFLIYYFVGCIIAAILPQFLGQPAEKIDWFVLIVIVPIFWPLVLLAIRP